MQISRIKIYQDINIYKFIYSYMLISYNNILNNANGCYACDKDSYILIGYLQYYNK